MQAAMPSHNRLSSPHDAANLDLLRSVAVLLVFFDHLYNVTTNHWSESSLASHLGRLGVLIFFVHTCLVLMWSLERSSVKGWRLFTSFYVRRIFRLYPLSIACVVLAYFIDLRWQPINIWSNLTLTQNLFSPGNQTVPPMFSSLWTLPLEVQMYVLLSVLFILFQKRPVYWLVITWVLFAIFAIFQPGFGNRLEILEFIPCFLGGVVAWRLMRDRETKIIDGWAWPAAIPLASIICLTATSQRFVPLHIATFGLCLGLLIPLFKDIPWNRLQNISRIIARYSYGIYLSHFAIQLYCFNDAKFHPVFKIIHQIPPLLHHSRLVHWSIFLLLSVLMPILLYHLIEKPGICMGHKLATHITAGGNFVDLEPELIESRKEA